MASKASQHEAIAPTLFEQRRIARERLGLATASVRRLGRKPVECLLHDISIYGCRIASPQAHRRGERVWVALAGRTPVSAMVMWTTAGMIGCRFDTPIDRAVVRSLIVAGL